MDARNLRIFLLKGLLRQNAMTGREACPCLARATQRQLAPRPAALPRLGDHLAARSDRCNVMVRGDGLPARATAARLRFLWLWFYSRRALAKFAGRHGIDAVGGRGILRFVLHFNLRCRLRRRQRPAPEHGCDGRRLRESLRSRRRGFCGAVSLRPWAVSTDGRPRCRRLRSLVAEIADTQR